MLQLIASPIDGQKTRPLTKERRDENDARASSQIDLSEETAEFLYGIITCESERSKPCLL